MLRSADWRKLDRAEMTGRLVSAVFQHFCVRGELHDLEATFDEE